MTSILSIPPEVTADVFQWAIILFSQSDCSNLSAPSLRQDAPPINVSQVCRDWHQIALSEPSLWAVIEVDAHGSEDLRRALPRVKTWLRRSSSSSTPLTLKISVDFDETVTTDDANLGELVDSLFRELGGHKHRWENVTISFTDIAATALKLDDLPLLQELHYHGFWSINVAANAQQRIDFSKSPLLRRFTASGTVELSTIPSNFILDNLTFMHLTICWDNSLTESDCLNVLRCTPNLKDFRVEFGPKDDFTMPKGCIQLANLSSLQVSWAWLGWGPKALKFLDGIDTPSLKKLSMDYPDHYCPEVPNERAAVMICDFISRCNISLTDLRMSTVFEDLDIVDILRLSPNLQKLDLHCYIIPKKLYSELSKMLVYKKSGRVEFPLCPRLASIFLFSERLKLHREHDGLEKMLHQSRPMVKMISRRWNVPNSQRSLSVVGVREFDTGDVPELKAMVSEGLDFRAHWEM